LTLRFINSGRLDLRLDLDLEAVREAAAVGELDRIGLSNCGSPMTWSWFFSTACS
jgi:hypothetical protein